MLRNFVATTISILLLSACVPFVTVKAPCNQGGIGCAEKVKINQW